MRRMKQARNNRRKCCLLIGAGCSVSAGIPAAAESVERIRRWRREDYARICDGDERPGYAECIALLSEDERQRFIT